MNADQAISHERTVIVDGRSDTSFLMSNLGSEDFTARRLQSGPTAA